jgi:hypothetical protein
MSRFYKVVSNISVFSVITTSRFGFNQKRCFCFDYVRTSRTVEKRSPFNTTIVKDQNFLYYLIIHSLLHKILSLSIFGVLVLSTFLSSYFENNFLTVSATIVSAKDQLMPFDLRDMVDVGQAQNESVENSSDRSTDDNQDSQIDCDMPPCPPGQACMQSCP